MEALDTILRTMEKVVLDASRILMDREKSSQIYQKGFADYVTQVDLQVQAVIRQQLTAAYPQIQFMGEEQDNSLLDPSIPLWILDPVDGTSNLIHDMKMSVISLGLAEKGEAVAGVIYQPYTGELFSAAKGHGAYLNGTPIAVSQTSRLSQAIIGIGTSPYHRDLTQRTCQTASRILSASMDIRRSGSAAMDLAYIAAGRLDGMVELILQPWDYAAGVILIQEAGGTVTDLAQAPLSLFSGCSVLATNGKIHKELGAAAAV